MEYAVGLPQDGLKRWRCNICSCLNLYDNNLCKRCQEPVNTETKKEWEVNLRKVSEPVKSSPIKNENGSKVVERSEKTSKSLAPNRVSRSHSQEEPPLKIAKQSIRHKSNAPSTSKLKTNNSAKTKRYNKPNLSEKHLGYKSNKKMVRLSVQSKLNYDTASYRSKFQNTTGSSSEGATKISGLKNSVQVATINDLTKNGFQTRIQHPKQPNETLNIKKSRQEVRKKIQSLQDSRPVTPPPPTKKEERQGNNGKRSLIDMLQKEHSGEIMANLRAKGRRVAAEVKDMEGGKSKYTL
ncbi:hypothetical protein RFI_07420 [Reticulomyxa filosa]|uniref:RanBP2-type domain-containing protein n=1 Tax=Reticulomyxa filosa TaxID=46433 RepID=X6NUJ3_RETFI|nr:hypothetical protein RFI_07420 [Reticulomyxa filosa]|eukprot:ETO29701.1 hypothetical protein RFI_07420 [Reticulomyxa filosa]